MRPFFIIASLAALVAGTVPAGATEWKFAMAGWLLPGDQLGDTVLTADTRFTFHAVFDDTTTNWMAPLSSSYVAYSPSVATLEIGGKHYDMPAFSPTNKGGITVSLFDATNPFGPPGHVGAGFAVDPYGDGNGFFGGGGVVADWNNATPDFSSQALSATHLRSADFFGAGYVNGYCVSGCFFEGEVDDPTPLQLLLGGDPVALTLRTTYPTYYNYGDFTGPPLIYHSFSASLTAVPEPASWSLLLTGFYVTGLAARRRRGMMLA